MPEQPTATDRLDSWKEIASYVGRDVRTVIRWEQRGGLPIHRVPVGQRQAVFAYRHEIDTWLKHGPEVANGNVVNIEFRAEQEESVEVLDVSPPVVHRRLETRTYRASLTAGGIALLGLGIFVIYSLAGPARVQFSGISQLTDDGNRKSGLVTDGTQIYFDELRDGKTVLASVPIEGGQVTTISTFLANATPNSISPDGGRLLVLNQEGKEEERSLWIVPVSGETPRRAGSIHCHSASWSPSGNRIVFAAGNGIYLTSDEGATTGLVHQFADVPERVQWTPNGDRLQFQLRDVHTGLFSLWELVLGGEGNSRMKSLTPLNVSFGQNGAHLVMLDDTGQAFMATSDSVSGKLSFLEREVGLSGITFRPRETDAHLPTIGMLAIDKSSHTLFALSGILPAADFLRYEQGSRSVSPFLPGLSAMDLDFSRDGQWLTYVKLPDSSLWLSRADGSQARQISGAATVVELPRWSPDGKQIAFMGQLAGKPWRIYLVSSRGGQAREASTGNDNQGAPTWSPDGEWLIYGNVKCQEVGACAIHKIDLAAGTVSLIPGSEGLATARWSPDGRYIGALQPERHQAYLFDLATQHWQKLADDVRGDDLAWSRDSRYLYASKPTGNRPEIIRIAIPNGKVDAAVDLSSLSKLKGRINTWFGIAPDGAIILQRSLNSEEVFALSYASR